MRTRARKCMHANLRTCMLVCAACVPACRPLHASTRMCVCVHRCPLAFLRAWCMAAPACAWLGLTSWMVIPPSVCVHICACVRAGPHMQARDCRTSLFFELVRWDRCAMICCLAYGLYHGLWSKSMAYRSTGLQAYRSMGQRGCSMAVQSTAYGMAYGAILYL